MINLKNYTGNNYKLISLHKIRKRFESCKISNYNNTWMLLYSKMYIYIMYVSRKHS